MEHRPGPSARFHGLGARECRASRVTSTRPRAPHPALDGRAEPLTLAGVRSSRVPSGRFPSSGSDAVIWGRRASRVRSQASRTSRTRGWPGRRWTAIHPVTLTIPLFLLPFWFLDGDRLVPFAPCAVWAHYSESSSASPSAGLGIWYWLAHGRLRRRTRDRGRRLRVDGHGREGHPASLCRRAEYLLRVLRGCRRLARGCREDASYRSRCAPLCAPLKP